jgi:hypothetical protein
MSSPKHLVAVRRAGSRTSLYLIHSLAGELTWMPALARDLDPEWPQYGFAAPGINNDAPSFTTLQELAAAHLGQGRFVLPGIESETSELMRKAGQRRGFPV